MSKIVTALSTSLDGFIAPIGDDPDEPLGAGGTPLFDWFRNGDTPSRHHPMFRMSKISADFFDEGIDNCGAVVAGRRTYDVSHGWGGAGPVPGAPLFVVTHRPPGFVSPSYTFVTDGVVSAIEQARKVAGDKNVALMGASMVQQALRAGLLDELVISLVPALLGRGVRLLDNIGEPMPELECVGVVDAPGVTHLTYRVVA